MSAKFQNYYRDRWYWFYVYLQLGALISEYPELSVKNSDFSVFLNDYDKANAKYNYIKQGIYFDPND